MSFYLLTVACPVLSHPKNWKVFTTGVSVTDTATFTCSTGYELVGDSTLTCQSDGTWDNPTPVCQGPSGKCKQFLFDVLTYACFQLCLKKQLIL